MKHLRPCNSTWSMSSQCHVAQVYQVLEYSTALGHGKSFFSVFSSMQKCVHCVQFLVPYKFLLLIFFRALDYGVSMFANFMI